MVRRFNIIRILCFLALIFGMIYSPLYAGEKVLRISMDAVDAGQASFNPFTTSTTNNVYYLVYDRLVEMGADGIIYPHLLESWNVSEDGLTITFSLKEGVKFHDGSDLNADVLKWFLENLGKANPSIWSPRLNPLISRII